MVGGGGHCLSVIDALCAQDYALIGIIDAPRSVGGSLCGMPVVGADGDIARLHGAYTHAFISLGSVGLWQKRKKLFIHAKEAGYALATIIHRQALISVSAQLGKGVFAAAGATVNAQAQIGENAILNTRCLVEHRCHVGAHTHIAPGAVLCGDVAIGEGTHVGAGSVVRQGITVGRNVMIGIGSVITKDIPDHALVYGNPGRIIRMREPT